MRFKLLMIVVVALALAALGRSGNLPAFWRATLAKPKPPEEGPDLKGVLHDIHDLHLGLEERAENNKKRNVPIH